jgi:hypothetical protein
MTNEENKVDKEQMPEFVAKPIVKDQFWVVTDGNRKVGNIVANNSGYGVQLNGSTLQFKNTAEIKNTAKIRFEPIKTNKTKAALPYPQYPTTSKVYNSIFDIKNGLHLFTTSKKSKCYHAAGWFVVEHNGVRQVSFCPKYIFIQRYPFSGPFKTEAEAQINI